MTERTYCRIFIIVCFTLYCCHGLKIIPERTTVTYVNEKYVTNVTANVRRSSRRGDYVFNMALYTYTSFGNNVTLHLSLYEYRSRYNQYVRTLIEFHLKWCDLILRDKLFGPSVRRAGLTQCPTNAGYYSVSNMTFNGYFPFEVAFEKGKLEGSWTLGPKGEKIGSIDTFVKFEN